MFGFIKQRKQQARGSRQTAALVEALEDRRLLTTTTTQVHYLAPATVAGGTLTATISGGTAPFAAAGQYTISTGSTGTLVNTASGSAITDLYEYSRIGAATAILRYTDASTNVSYADTLTFSSGTSGTYAINAAGAGVAAGADGTQTGSFTFAPVTQPLGADLIISLIKSPAGIAVRSGQGTVVVVNVANVGNAGAVGFDTVTYYLSPDGMLADATRIAASGKVLAVGLQHSSFIGRELLFPVVPSGSYYLVAAMTPSLALTDTDRSNDVAVATLPILLDSSNAAPQVPLPSVSLSSSIRGVAPQGLVGGKLAVVVATLTNNSDQLFEGNVSMNLLASSDAQGDSPAVLLAFDKKIAIEAGATASFPVRMIVPTTLASGNYFLLVESGPSSTRVELENGVMTTVQVPVSAVTALATPVTITHPPVPTLAVSIGGVLSEPTTPTGSAVPLAADQLVDVPVTITNTDSGIALGRITFRLFASPIGNPDAIINIPVSGTIVQGIRLEPGEAMTIVVPVRVYRSLLVLAPEYDLIAVVNALSVPNVTATRVTGAAADLFSVVG